jgi:hypothetical protein
MISIPASNRIYNAWIDGYEDPTNGSLVGYANPPFAEQTIVHGGFQSMPLEYDNSTAVISEATLTSRRDWTLKGARELSLWFYGDASNSPEPMYVAIADSSGSAAIVYYDDPAATQIGAWTEWIIEFTTFEDQGVNLTNVDKISIGLGDKSNPQAGGLGILYFDDIRLYAPRQVSP